jgi:hypothetical protein
MIHNIEKYVGLTPNNFQMYPKICVQKLSVLEVRNTKVSSKSIRCFWSCNNSKFEPGASEYRTRALLTDQPVGLISRLDST